MANPGGPLAGIKVLDVAGMIAAPSACAMMADLGHKLELEILTDASAAKGIASRRGLGKTRHVAVHFLWVQERVRNGDLVVSKVWGGDNPADLLTKYLTRDKMDRCMLTFGLEHKDGRSAEAPEVAK